MYEEQKLETGNVRNVGFLRPLISAYSLPLHGMTAIPGKISGALMIVDSIEDAVPLIHGPIGCAFQRKINPFRPYLTFYETPCTDMNDLDVVYGGEDKLSQGIKETYEKYHPNLIVVITTCPSDLIGDDFRAVVEETKAKADVGCDVVYTAGDFIGKSKPIGQQDTLYAITDQMLCNNNNMEEVERNDGSVNIFTYQVHGIDSMVAEMASILSEMGIKLNKIFFDHTTVKDLYELPKADLTITNPPMVWTKLMKERFGVDHYEIMAFDRYTKTRDPELLNPYGIEGSARVLMEIAQRLGKEGEAEEVIARRKKDALERLSKVKKHLEGKKVVGMSPTMLRDTGMEVSVIISKTRGLERRLTTEAINERLNMSVELARKYGSDPEVLVNPTLEAEIRAIKKTGTDLVISAGATAHRYNREGIRTFNLMGFMLYHRRIGFESPVELAVQLTEALKRPVRKKNPLLSMLEYDSYRTNLLPEWATLADMFGVLREAAVGDKEEYESGVGFEEEEVLGDRFEVICDR
jgi:nitrogenase molybdenum-cofactor synthesis protein NifE